MSVEFYGNNNIFEEKTEHEKIETEKKFRLVDPDFLNHLREHCAVQRITQIYLSHPNEPYSLRLRKTLAENDDISYSATLKDRGVITPHGLSRKETPVEISENTFDSYNTGEYPTLLKERIEPASGVSIDWICGLEDGPLLEIEDLETNDEAKSFYQTYKDQLVDKSGQAEVSNEHIAHSQTSADIMPKRQLQPDKIAGEILAYKSIGAKKLVVTIAGRSGSGKTTSIKEIQRLLIATGASVTILSTDDYHRGKSFLEQNYSSPWTDWDAAIVYDTEALASDILQLNEGKDIAKRQFNFATQEPSIEGLVSAQDIVLIEGIHAGSKDLDSTRNLHFDVGTPLATCIGRDLARLRSGERASDALNPTEARLRYQLEVAEPTYQSLNRPSRNRWSGCARPIGGIALKTN